MNKIETIDDFLNQSAGFIPAEKKLLRDQVEHSLLNYFSRLGNTLIDDLYETVLSEIEAPLLKAVMEKTKGNQTKAAILLGLSRGTLRKKLKKYRLL